MERFGELVACQAARAPDAPAVVFGDLRWTYRELCARVDECARALIACGIARGDRIATMATPRPEYLVVYLATARIGAIWIGLNPVQRLDEYRYLLNDAQPKLLFAMAAFRSRDNLAILKALSAEFRCLRHTVVFGESPPEFMSFAQFVAWSGKTSPAELAAWAAATSPDDVALIVYTSGSTGRPKGAMLTQRSIAFCAYLYLWRWPLQPMRAICNLPISHIACSTETVAFVLAAGGTIVFQEYFEPQPFLQMIRDEQITWITILPTMFQRILTLPDWRDHDTSSLRVVVFGGAAMSTDMIELLAHLGGTLFTLWGLTESTAAVTFTEWNDGTDVLSESVGRAGPGCEVTIMQGSQEMPVGAIGEVVIRGPCVFAGYFGMPESTAATVDVEGWLHSGDLGRRDSEGRIYIVGRIKEMFKSGGYNVYPREVEVAIESHPAVSIVAVVSAPDTTYQEVGYAFVIPTAGGEVTGEALALHCREKIANYKVPKRFIIRGTLPMLAIGKVDKVALRAEAAVLAAKEPDS